MFNLPLDAQTDQGTGNLAPSLPYCTFHSLVSG